MDAIRIDLCLMQLFPATLVFYILDQVVATKSVQNADHLPNECLVQNATSLNNTNRQFAKLVLVKNLMPMVTGKAARWFTKRVTLWSKSMAGLKTMDINLNTF